jgi:hypothetical protein
MTFDTLKYNGTERTFAAWGISRSGCRLTRRNQSIDTFHARIPTANISDDPIFPFEAVVEIRTGRVSDSGADNSFSGGTLKFTGKRVGMEAMASGKSMGVHFEFQGPWYDLSNTHYLQTFKGVAVNPFAPGEVILNTSTANATRSLIFISIGDQIQSILQWLLDQYSAQGMAAPFQYTGRALNAGAIDLSFTGAAALGPNTDKSGNAYDFHVVATPTIDAALYAQFLPSYIAKPMMCSQALQKMLQLSPRTNIAFDYSTTPPTISVKSIDNYPPVSLALFNGIDHKEITIKRRDDLVARSVIITYRITNTVNGQQVLDYAIDKWGSHGSNNAADPGAGLRVLSETIDLQGYNVTTTTAQLDCEPLACRGGTNATKRGWWSSRRGGEQAKFIDSRVRFQDNNFAQTTIPDATLTYATNDFANFRIAGQALSNSDLALFTNRIVRGTHHSWMTQGSVSVKSLKVRVTMKTEHATYDVVATGDTLGQVPANEAASNTAVNGNRQGKLNTEETHCDIELTNAANAVDGTPFTATTIASTTPGEIYIIGEGGIAQYVFYSLAALQYDGDYAKVEADFTNNVSLMNSINFTNGRAEWFAMNAQAQSIIEDFGTKETLLQIGVSNNLTAGELSSMLNMWAFRRPWYNPAVRADNAAGGGGGQVTMPQSTGGANGTAGVANHNDFVTTNYATPGDPTTTVNGQISLTAKKVNDILIATTPTLVDPAIAAHKLEPKEIQFCDASGNVVYAVGILGGFYTKP